MTREQPPPPFGTLFSLKASLARDGCVSTPASIVDEAQRDDGDRETWCVELKNECD